MGLARRSQQLTYESLERYYNDSKDFSSLTLGALRGQAVEAGYVLR